MTDATHSDATQLQLEQLNRLDHCIEVLTRHANTARDAAQKPEEYGPVIELWSVIRRLRLTRALVENPAERRTIIIPKTTPVSFDSVDECFKWMDEKVAPLLTKKTGQAQDIEPDE